jgi:hypothetical protein
MAKDDETKAPESKPETKAPARAEVRFDDSKTIACYANFCRVTGTPEELIIDFGLNNQPMGAPTDAIPITQRIIVNFFTAKRLLGALSMSVQRHEAAFGVLETDVNKRVQSSARAPAPTAPPQKA